MRLFLVDHLRCAELLVLLVLDVTQQEHKILAFAWLQGYLDVMRGDGAPTMGVAVAGLALDYYLGIGKLVIETYEGFTIGIEALDRGVYMVERIMVATLTVLGLVIDGATLDLDLTGREITLEILHIGSSIPQAPLLEREQF